MSGTKAGAAKAKLAGTYAQRGRTSSKEAQGQVRYATLQQMRNDLVVVMNNNIDFDGRIAKLQDAVQFLMRQHRDVAAQGRRDAAAPNPDVMPEAVHSNFPGEVKVPRSRGTGAE